MAPNSLDLAAIYKKRRDVTGEVYIYMTFRNAVQ